MLYPYLSVNYIILFVDQINFMFEKWFDNRCNYFFCFFYSLTRLFKPLDTLIVFPFASLDCTSILEIKFSDAVLLIVFVRTIIVVAALKRIFPVALPFAMVIVTFILYASRRSILTIGMLLAHVVEAFVACTARQLL